MAKRRDKITAEVKADYPFATPQEIEMITNIRLGETNANNKSH